MDSVPKTEVVSSVTLQMTLYFNALFAPLWIIVHACTLYMKFAALPITYKVTLVALHIAALIVEITRLYLGIVGNLRERIPELSGFWITTVILQLPAVCYVTFHRPLLLLPLENAVDVIQLFFILVQVFAGAAAVRRLARHQVARFQQTVLSKEQ